MDQDPFRVTPSGYDRPYQPSYLKEKEHRDEPKHRSFGKRLLFWLLLLFFTFGFALTLSEVVLRIVPGRWSNSFFYVYDPVLGTWHVPSHSGDYVTEDFATHGIEINSFGMRDKERTIEKTSGPTRIAILGDSFTEAMHVANDQTFAQVMEKNAGGKAEVLNFGVAGFGTVQELLTYREKVRQFKPDIVILAFLSANDMRNNSRPLEDLYSGSYNTDRPFPRLVGSGTWDIVSPEPNPLANNPYVLFAKRHLTTYRFLWYAKSALQARFASVSPATSTSTPSDPVADTGENVQVYLSRLFMPPEEEPFISAWGATEWAIKELQSEAEKDGGKFILVMLPDEPHLEWDPKKALETEFSVTLPDGFDIDYPEKRLKAFSQKEGVAFLDMTPAFRSARDKENLQPPFFSYPHDGHWTPKGHQLAGETILAYLKDRGLVPR